MAPTSDPLVLSSGRKNTRLREESININSVSILRRRELVKSFEGRRLDIMGGTNEDGEYQVDTCA